MLLRTSGMGDMQTLFKAYGHFASFTLHMHRQTCPVRRLIDDAHDRCVRLLDFGESTLLSPEYQKFYKRFRSRYVKNRKSHTEAHHTDEILFAILCARHLREYDADGDLEKHSRGLHEAACSYARAMETNDPPALDSGSLARIARAHPNLAGPGASLTPAQWALLLEAFAPLLA